MKECHQICPGGKCLYKCDAEKCKVEGCFDGSPCTTVNPTSSAAAATASKKRNNATSPTITVKGCAGAPIQMWSSVFGGLIFASIVCMQIIKTW